MVQFFMRQKSTIYSPEFHNQFQKSEESVRNEKMKRTEGMGKEIKEGQSKYRIERSVKKGIVLSNPV